MIGYRDLLNCDVSVFARDATKWQELAGELADRGTEVETAAKRLEAWSGAAADAAKAEFAAHRKQYADMAATVSKIPAVFTDLSAQINALQNQLRRIVNEASSLGYQVYDDGTVSYEPDIVHHLSPGQEDLSADAAHVYQGGIADLVRQAQDADAHAAAALNGLSAQATGFAPAANDSTVAAAATAIPALGTAPADVKKWWDGLSPVQQESLLFTHPDQLGQLDGLPSVVRDRANRARMAEQKGSLQADKERLDLLGDARTSEQSAQLNAINQSLGGIDAIEQRLYKPKSDQQPAFLLGFDSAGTGRAIVAMGNPDTAMNVATYVPGTGASLGSINGDLTRSDRMVQAAHNAGSPATSVITWVGYNAPQQVFPDAAQDRWADGAKQDLDRFQDGLRASHEEGFRAHNTVIGHSYGTTVVGHAARDGNLNADDVVFVASPGVGVTNADQLHLDGVPPGQIGQHVHSTVAQYDPIQLAAGINGPDPTGPDFGGTTFDSNPGAAGSWYELGWNGAVHSQYWDQGNKALVNMGRIIAGKPTY